AEVGEARAGGVVRDRRGANVEVARPLELLRRELGADDHAVLLDQAAVRLALEGHLCEAGHHRRIREAEDRGEHEDRDHRADDVLHQCISLSTIGPSVSAGKIIRPAVSAITPTSRTTNVGPSVRKVPAEYGTVFLAASEPPSASAASSGTNRPR